MTRDCHFIKVQSLGFVHFYAFFKKYLPVNTVLSLRNFQPGDEEKAGKSYSGKRISEREEGFRSNAGEAYSPLGVRELQRIRFSEESSDRRLGLGE